MAIMIPYVISPDVKSNAERRIFSWFQNARGTEEWIVLHSLGITNHNRVIHGEVDFFVLAPKLGMFAIEVKGGRVKRENGIWSFTDKYGHTDSRARGPFDQAWEGVYSIVNSYSDKLDTSHQYLNNMLFGIGVMFPDIEYSSVGVDEEQWQVFDIKDGNDIYNYVKKLSEGTKGIWHQKNRKIRGINIPTVEDVRLIADYLRGDFDKAILLRAQIDYINEELITLTKQQYRCIDQLEDNPRCLIKGHAGTGKTLIALEAVKNSVAKNEKVAMFCYNNNLGKWLENYFLNMPINLRPLYVGTLHGFMYKALRDKDIHLEKPLNDEDVRRFYNEILPSYTTEILSSYEYKFDKIIVDEAQDLVTKTYLNLFDACLKKGLYRGKWILLGDFSMQAIYNKHIENNMEYLESIASFARFSLNLNCRNTKKICNEIETVTGININCSNGHSVDGIPVQYYTYKDKDEQKNKLIKIISDLKENHIDEGQITILAPRKRSDSIIAELSNIEVKNYCIPEIERITFSTIQSFKGLENAIIILVDIENFSDIQLMYIGFSRARSGLYVLVSENAQEEYTKLYIQRRCENVRHT